MLDIIKSIFYGRELTIGGGKPTLNKWVVGTKIEVSSGLAKLMGTFILTQYFSYTTQNFMIFPIWALIVSIWRGVYILSN